MDDFKRKAATKERGNNITPPRRKDPKENKRQRSRLKRELPPLPKPPILDEPACPAGLEEACVVVERMLSDKPALAKCLIEAIRNLEPKGEPRERMIPESHARWIIDEMATVSLTDDDWASLLTEAAAACSTK